MMEFSISFLKLQNFGPFRSLEFTFEPGSVLINGYNNNTTGSNASGKSSIKEAIEFALFKKSRLRDPSHLGQGGSSVELHYNIGATRFKVIRYHRHSEHKNGVEYFVTDPQGDFVCCTQALPTQTSDKIIKDLGFDIVQARNLIILDAEDTKSNFSNLTPVARKQLLEDTLIKFDFDHYQKIFKKKELATSGELSKINTQIQEAEKKHSYYLGMIEQAKESSRAQLESLTSQKKEYEHKLQEVEPDLLRAEHLYKSTLETVRDYNSLNDKIVSLRSSLDSYRSQYLSGTCPTCNQPLSPQQKEQIIKRAKADKAILVDLEKEISTIRIDTIDEVAQQKEYESLKEIFSSTRTIIGQLSVQIDKLMNNTSGGHYTKELHQIEASLETLYTKRKALDSRLSDIGQVVQSLTPKSTFRTSLIKTITESLDALTKKYLAFLSPELQSSVSLTEKMDGISLVCATRSNFDQTDSTDSLSGGENRRLQLAVALAFRDLVCSSLGIYPRFIFVDEYLDKLDAPGISLAFEAISTSLPKDSTFVIVTHNPAVVPLVDQTITVVKTAAESQLLKDNQLCSTLEKSSESPSKTDKKKSPTSTRPSNKHIVKAMSLKSPSRPKKSQKTPMTQKR